MVGFNCELYCVSVYDFCSFPCMTVSSTYGCTMCTVLLSVWLCLCAVLHQEAPDWCHSGDPCQQLCGRGDRCPGIQKTPQPLQKNRLGLHVQVCWGVCTTSPVVSYHNTIVGDCECEQPKWDFSHKLYSLFPMLSLFHTIILWTPDWTTSTLLLYWPYCRNIRVVRDITPDNHLIHLAMKSPQPDKQPKDFVLLACERPRMEYEGWEETLNRLDPLSAHNYYFRYQLNAIAYRSVLYEDLPELDSYDRSHVWMIVYAYIRLL